MNVNKYSQTIPIINTVMDDVKKYGLHRIGGWLVTTDDGLKVILQEEECQHDEPKTATENKEQDIEKPTFPSNRKKLNAIIHSLLVIQEDL